MVRLAGELARPSDVGAQWRVQPLEENHDFCWDCPAGQRTLSDEYLVGKKRRRRFFQVEDAILLSN